MTALKRLLRALIVLITTKRLIAALIGFTLVIGGANLLATHQAVSSSQHAQEHELALSQRQEQHAITVARAAAEAAAQRAIASNNRRWCHVLSLIDKSSAAHRPRTKVAVAFFADFRRLARQFHCPT